MDWDGGGGLPKSSIKVNKKVDGEFFSISSEGLPGLLASPRRRKAATLPQELL